MFVRIIHILHCDTARISRLCKNVLDANELCEFEIPDNELGTAPLDSKAYTQ